MKKNLLFVLLFLANATYGQTLPIVPYPQQVQYRADTCDLTKAFSFKRPDDQFSLAGIAKVFQDVEVFAKSDQPAKKKLTVWIDKIPNNEKLQRFCQKNNLLTDKIGKEGYHLVVQPDSIILAANTDAGILYGLQSLRQLLQYYQPKGAIPCVQITDFPAFKYRAVMDDISRGPISNISFLKAQIRRLSALKINVFTFYIEHVVKTKRHPLFAPEDGITVAEFQELSDYAKEWNIELLGSFQSLGHFRNVLNAPAYRHLGATDRMLRPAATESLQFLQEVYGEMLPAFSSDFFNINADEAWDLVRGDLKPVADSLGAGKLFANHVVPLLNYLIKNNKHPMMWGDMLLAYPDAFNYLPKETTILTWGYSDFDNFSNWIDPIQQRRFDFWVCPGIVNSNKLLPNYETTFINLKNFINEGHQKGAKGVMTTIWDDGGGHLFKKDWYGVAYAADQSWRPNRADFDSFDQRFSKTFYQDEYNRLPTIIAAFQGLKQLNSTQKLQYAFLEEQLLPDFGEAHRLNVKDVAAIAKMVNETQELLKELRQQKVHYSKDNEWQNDLAFWQFFGTHLSTLVTTYQTILEVANTYKKARQLQAKQQSNYSIHLVSNQHKVQDLLKKWTNLKAAYVRLWFQENRLHSLDEATAMFDDKIAALTQLLTLLTYVENLPSNVPLPTPEAIKLSIAPNYDN
ncbi:MAG: glycoside hydrolase family 20 zincin-like fold domain-containing protein [Bacteroidota bacterium]